MGDGLTEGPGAALEGARLAVVAPRVARFAVVGLLVAHGVILL